MQIIKLVLIFSIIAISPGYANAYVGPGLGAGTIGVVLGIVGSLFIALFAIVWYPLKRLIKRNRKSEHQNSIKKSDQ